MANPRFRNLLLLGLAFALSCLQVFAAQDTKSSGDSGKKPSPPSTVNKDTKTPSLEEATRVSTERAIQSAVQEASTKHDFNGAETPRPGASTDSAVVEFHPLKDSGDSAQQTDKTSKNSKKSPLKNVHGTVYGSTDPNGSGNRAAGASAGATSKGGKTSIYVETDRSRTTSPK